MCGIAGVFRFGGGEPPGAAALRRMAATLVHRGPDGEGLSLRGPIGLAHRRLAVLDLEGGRQPMANEDGSVEVVFNGEIYDHDEHRERLRAKGHVFRTRSDTEVLVHLYEEEGERTPELLRGEFAFAIADHRRRRVLLARDRCGVKPLYYALDGNRLVFASESTAVLAEGSTPRAVDPAAVLDYLAYRAVPSPRTIWRDVRKLPPATLLVVDAEGRATERRWWRLRFEPDERTSPEEWGLRLRETIAEAVRLQMAADVPVGGFLSGGLDSSTVLSFMRLATTGALVACSVGFEDPRFDEVEHARAVARQLRADHRTTVLTPDMVRAADVAERLARRFDEPFGDSSAVPAFLVARQAREHVTVALSGDGGDEAFGGYRRYRFERAEARLRHLVPGPFRSAVFGTLAGVYPKADSLPRPLRAQTTLRNLAEEHPARAYFRSVGTTAGVDRDALLRPETLLAAGGHDPAARIEEAFRDAGTDDPVARAQACDLGLYLPEDILTKVDRTAMSVSLEVRVPLLDVRVLELAARIPSKWKVRRGRGKWILREAMRPRLPAEVLDRPKRGFSVPMAHWLRTELHDYAAERLLAPDARLGEWFDPAAVRTLWDLHQRGARDVSDLLWVVLRFEAWARAHLGANSPAPDPAAETRDRDDAASAAAGAAS
jgi:asparagine synthase (glutamine-hydrolysing)